MKYKVIKLETDSDNPELYDALTNFYLGTADDFKKTKSKSDVAQQIIVVGELKGTEAECKLKKLDPLELAGTGTLFFCDAIAARDQKNADEIAKLIANTTGRIVSYNAYNCKCDFEQDEKKFIFRSFSEAFCYEKFRTAVPDIGDNPGYILPNTQRTFSYEIPYDDKIYGHFVDLEEDSDQDLFENMSSPRIAAQEHPIRDITTETSSESPRCKKQKL